MPISIYHFIQHILKIRSSARYLLQVHLPQCWRGGLFDWPSHGRGKESKVVQNMRYLSAIVLARRVVAVIHSEGVGAEDDEVLGVA
jgi:hypothetical protein